VRRGRGLANGSKIPDFSCHARLNILDVSVVYEDAVNATGFVHELMWTGKFLSVVPTWLDINQTIVLHRKQTDGNIRISRCQPLEAANAEEMPPCNERGNRQDNQKDLKPIHWRDPSSDFG
jgi:hypothetical protein